MMAPLMQGTRGLGAIALMRAKLGGFTDREQALLKTFADQAVIAIQNARLFNETKEALERQTASTEVLQVINASPGDISPVFDVIRDKAVTLCDADFGGLWLVEGDMARSVALGQGNMPPAFAEWSARAIVPVSHLLGRNAHENPYFHAADLKALKVYETGLPVVVASVDLGGIRTNLSVPLFDEGRQIIGVFTLVRTTVRPFSDKQIALVQGFAAQAQIAMRNARLMNETQEALERQTATSDVLRVISESPTDVQPVFEAIAERARALCAADIGIDHAAATAI